MSNQYSQNEEIQVHDENLNNAQLDCDFIHKDERIESIKQNKNNNGDQQDDLVYQDEREDNRKININNDDNVDVNECQVQFQNLNILLNNNDIEKIEDPLKNIDSLSDQKLNQQMLILDLNINNQKKEISKNEPAPQIDKQEKQVQKNNLQQEHDVCFCGDQINHNKFNKHYVCFNLVECFFCEQLINQTLYEQHIIQDHKENICQNCGILDLDITNQNHRLRCFQNKVLNIDDAKMQQLDSQKDNPYSDQDYNFDNDSDDNYDGEYYQNDIKL